MPLFYLKDEGPRPKSLKNHLLGQTTGHPRGLGTVSDKTLEAIPQTLVVVTDRQSGAISPNFSTTRRRNFRKGIYSSRLGRPKAHWLSLYHSLSIQIPTDSRIRILAPVLKKSDHIVKIILPELGKENQRRTEPISDSNKNQIRGMSKRSLLDRL